ncbi:MOSC domain-containing protein [Acidipila sp. EB88]|uniref:MOSC domain-containing protein n=1 Tax=Acidipila sp. EB88 TaxID=2305226 RepID=UPI000F5E597C|nr:MOSC N-terminal beta barrel domain-containing protein [Acidipila sp. EB88]RRA47222.1 MOSC domain-containing protein [Acidipila sp. EB88]
MTPVGHVESLWRYPVKSMRGEQLQAAFATVRGICGDRRFAISSSAAPAVLPYLTSRTQEQMLLYRPFWPAGSEPETWDVDAARRALLVETPTGEQLALDDPRLLQMLGEQLRVPTTLAVVASAAALTDELPLSLFSVQTARQLEQEIDTPVDKRRFRANVYLDLANATGFAEDHFVGRRLQLGSAGQGRDATAVIVEVVRRDPRCKIITLSPDTSEASPQILRHVATTHERCAGVYATVVQEGWLRQGDAVFLLD